MFLRQLLLVTKTSLKKRGDMKNRYEFFLGHESRDIEIACIKSFLADMSVSYAYLHPGSKPRVSSFGSLIICSEEAGFIPVIVGVKIKKDDYPKIPKGTILIERPQGNNDDPSMFKRVFDLVCVPDQN